MVGNAAEINRRASIAIGSFADSHFHEIGLKLANQRQAAKQYKNSKVKTKTFPNFLATVVATFFVKSAALGLPAADDNPGQHLSANAELQAFAR